MRQREHERRLVGLVDGTEEIGLPWVAFHEETREVVLVVLDVVFQNLHAVHLSCLSMADGCDAPQLMFVYILGGSGGILGFHGFQRGMVAQVLAALHQGDGVGVDFGDGVPVVIGQTADAMRDVQLVLTYDGGARVAQQFIVVEQAAGNSVFNGGHADAGGVALDILEHLFEGGAADELYLLALEILMGGDVVERPEFSLYGYSLHILFYFYILKKKSHLIVVKRDLNVFLFSFCL